MTVGEFKKQLSQMPDETLCCGTFWLAEDFLALDSTLAADEIEAAMEIAVDSHDAEYGFNWYHLQLAIWRLKEVS